MFDIYFMSFKKHEYLSTQQLQRGCNAMSEMSPRNLQLGIFSLLFSGLGLGYSAQEISDKGLLYGYSNAVVCLLLLQSGDKEQMNNVG